ncbi:hypothetical protein GCM10007978_36090 [Shewanella hanedai]|uniref:DUF3634 family protein n=1 Tax=Shewanella hanedai TaxID=25 RepID=A0A553JJH4_SHEHA|nr:DUF3634 family protein [Shewanella hanedai]TRY12548.1 DUF3634 family protein [Shewanella hanedai]GGI95200.1 hypothetical protein GCM10007978_36090 [Shewanella hanedai]
MNSDVLKVIFVLIGLFLVYKLIFSGKKGLTIFEMHFKNGRLDSHKGKIPEKFQKECRTIAKAEKLTCSVKCEKSGSVRLHVSANVSDDITQRIRNVFPFEYYDKKLVDNSRQAG